MKLSPAYWAALLGFGALLAFSAKKFAGAENKAEEELQKWEGLRESDPAGAAMVRQYWAEGARKHMPSIDTPWSAAFIQYVTGGVMAPTASHMIYAGEAMTGGGPYQIYRSESTPVREGDLILRNRSGGKLSFENIGHGHGNSHVDIVTKVSPGLARAIGGNKQQNVAVENYYLSKSGTVTDPRAFAILRRT